MYKYVHQLNSEFWKQKTKAVSQDPYSQHENGVATSSQDQEQRDAVTMLLILLWGKENEREG